MDASDDADGRQVDAGMLELHTGGATTCTARQEDPWQAAQRCRRDVGGGRTEERDEGLTMGHSATGLVERVQEPVICFGSGLLYLQTVSNTGTTCIRCCTNWSVSHK